MSRARAKRLKPEQCPTVRKSAYTTRRKAELALDRLYAAGFDTTGWRVYRCACAAWHITSKPYHTAGSQPWQSNRAATPFKAPKKPRCSRCGRRWLSDLDPAGRTCPACLAPDSYSRRAA